MINDSALIRISSGYGFLFNDDCMRILAETVDGSYQLEGIDIVENEKLSTCINEANRSADFKKSYPELAQYYRFKRLPKSCKCLSYF